MQLIPALSAGVTGAALGTAVIYRRGTNLRPTLYADFEGTLHPESGGDVSLDSYGRAVVFVNELVDVNAKDADGASVVAFTEGEAAPNVEVRSLSFTGTNYDSGASGAGQPTTLQAILDLARTSFGATNWQVDVDGTPKNLSVALASILGIFINVKDPTYAAEGDGIVDDTAAIQAALTAAGTPQSIVFFPAGTYRITSALTVPVGVSLWGVGPSGSSINMDHATANTLTFTTGTSVGYQEVRGLTLTANQTNTGRVIYLTSAGTRWVAVVNCRVGFTNNTGEGIVTDGNNHRLLVDTSEVRAAGVESRCIYTSQLQAQVQCRDSRFICLPAAYSAANGMVDAINITATACVFDMSAKSSDNATCLGIYGDDSPLMPPNAVITGCTFIPGSGGNNYAIFYTPVAFNIAGTAMVESGNNFYPGFTQIYFGWTQTASVPVMVQGSREQREETSTDNTATVDCDADQCGIFVLTRTNNSAQAITTSVPPAGAKFTLCVYNNSGGVLGTISFGSGFATSTTSITTLANGKLATYHFQSVYLSGGLAMVPLAAYTTVL